jgi:hypothetical protein
MSHYGSNSTAKESYVNYNPSKSSGSERSGTSGGTRGHRYSDGHRGLQRGRGSKGGSGIVILSKGSSSTACTCLVPTGSSGS